jgi:enoyl-CoA hydratase/carnithine racemase
MSTLRISRVGRVLRLELNRPEKRNALNGDLCWELASAIEEGDRDSTVGAILLGGAGKSFCAGMDLDEMLTPAQDALAEVHERLFTIGARATTPIIAAIHGAALAGGSGLAANAHIVIASTDATFGLTEIRIGLWPFLIFRAVAAALGERRTVELSITGRVISVAEASLLGLVHQVVSLEDLETKAVEMAQEIAEASPEAMRSGLRFVAETHGLDRDDAGKLAQRFRSELFASADFAEGIRAFREKRNPRWPSLAL